MRNVTLFLLLVFLLGSFAQASDLSFMPAQSESQKQLKASLEHGDYRQALRTWSDATKASAFAESENGRAIYGFILAQNGLPISAMKSLLSDTSADRINPTVLALWRPILNSYISEIPPGWNINASWMRLFPSNIAPIKKASQIPGRLQSAERLANDDLNKTKQLWMIATVAPEFGDVQSALKATSSLRSCKQNLIGIDQIELATARILYQKGAIADAITHYNSIPKSSDFWIESAEERSWAYLRQNNHDLAVSNLTTVLSPTFAKLTGPEPYFLSELESLRVCDYPKILKTSKLFKERHKERLSEIEKLAKTGNNKGLGSLLAGFDKDGYSIEAAGSDLQWMPRNFMRDREFSNQMKLRLDLLAENKRAQANLKDLVSGDIALSKTISDNQKQADIARAGAVARLRQLANIDLAEYRLILNKLHIIEGEVIERLYVDESLKGKRKDVAPIKDARNTLSFPYTDKEVWLDELDHYQSRVKDCPALPSTKGASL